MFDKGRVGFVSRGKIKVSTFLCGVSVFSLRFYEFLIMKLSALQIGFLIVPTNGCLLCVCVCGIRAQHHEKSLSLNTGSSLAENHKT
jgi:hypothetical protein